jgi:hypothetical protein
MDKKAIHYIDCPSPHHNTEHLCYLMYEGFHLSNPDEYKVLVKDAKFRCQQCGRTAHSADNLCMPEPL